MTAKEKEFIKEFVADIEMNLCINACQYGVLMELVCELFKLTGNVDNEIFQDYYHGRGQYKRLSQKCKDDNPYYKKGKVDNG